ncbi:hypothetical protein GCM10022290_31480 [Sagittula marina]
MADEDRGLVQMLDDALAVIAQADLFDVGGIVAVTWHIYGNRFVPQSLQGRDHIAPAPCAVRCAVDQ